MIPLAVPNLTGNEKKYLDDCIDTTFVSSVGEYVNRIESMSASLTGAKYGVATSAGTTALHTALIAAGVKRDDLVIMPSFTFIATANSTAHAGAVPWFMDIDKYSWTIDVEQLEFELEKNTDFVDISFDGEKKKCLIHKKSGRRVAAIMPVYTLGNIPNMDKLMKVAADYELPVIADAAAAIGSKYKNKKVAEMADLTTLSFNGNKTVTAGGGGMILGNDKGMLDLCRHLSTTARLTKEYDFDMVGYNYRMTNIQAAVGVAQLERLDEFVEKKRYIRKFYRDNLGSLKEIEFFNEPEDVYSSCWFSGVVMKNGSLEKTREICSGLFDEGIEARTFWKPVHLQTPYKDSIISESLENTENIWDKIVTLPCSTGITDAELESVCNSVKKIWEK